MVDWAVTWRWPFPAAREMLTIPPINHLTITERVRYMENILFFGKIFFVKTHFTAEAQRTQRKRREKRLVRLCVSSAHSAPLR
jgi:hypothetical protein